MTRTAFAIACILVLAGCGPGGGSGGSGESPAPVEPASPTLVVSPASVSLSTGDTVRLTAAAPATWQSLNPSIASVSASGVVTALAAGTATIKATLSSDPAVTGLATIQCFTLSASSTFDILAVSGSRTLMRIPRAGGWPIALDPAPVPTYILGQASIPGGSYLLTAGEGYELWFADWIAGTCEFKGRVPFAVSTKMYALAVDPQKRVYTIDISRDKIMRFDPVTGEAADWANAPGMLAGGMCFDASGRLYVSDLMQGSVFRVSPAGVSTEIVSLADEYGGGVAISADGSIVYTACYTKAGPDSVGSVYRCVDLDGDGKRNGAGETTLCATGFTTPFGIFWTGDSLIVNDQWTGLAWRLADLGADGLFLGAGETTLWSEAGLDGSAATHSLFAFRMR